MKNNIWFTSDTHYYHKNIAGPKVSIWKTGYRDFEDEKEMSSQIVKTFNKYVKSDDIVYHLGDWSFGGVESIWNFRKQLECKNIHLITGNHDEHIIKNKLLLNSFNAYDECPYKAKELFSSVQPDLILADITEDKVHTFHLNHYAKRVWYNSNKGGIHLFGHSHGSMPMYGKSMDVGIDVSYKMFGEYRPFHIEEIITIMKDREIEYPDHHSSETNVTKLK